MASEGPPQSEEIVCVRVPCRDGRERVWRAIELLHPMFKGVWSTAVNFAPLPLLDTRSGQYPQRHR
jgi:hypothetical protein